MTDTQSPRDKLWAMIRKARFAMFTTQEAGETLRSRPMTTIQRELTDSLWFFTRADSEVTQAVRAFPQVSLSYGNSDDLGFVCVAGPTVVVSDVLKKQVLWNAMVQAWLPEGPDSPEVVLLKVTIEHAEYWDSASNKLVQLVGIVKALATGTPPQNVGDHQTVTM